MITFSGIDCSGKSTQIDLLKQHFKSNGIKHRVIWSRGGYTSWVEGIKNLVRPDKNFSEDQKKEYRASVNSDSRKARLLLFASICDLIRYYGVVFRLIELSGTRLICDRYIWDTYIDFRLKFPQLDFERWSCWKLLMKTYKKPDHSFIFVIPPEESMRRSQLKIEPFPETLEERKIRIDSYLQEIQNGRWQYVIDGERAKDEIANEILGIAG